MNIRLITALILWTAPTALAQEVTGQIEGRVLARDGSAISSVNVTATSPNLLGVRTTTTDENGRFFLRALPVGIYTVQVRSIGYRPVAFDSVQVWLGSVTALAAVELLTQPVVELEPVVVVPDDDALDQTRTASSVVLGRDRLSQLPLGRNFREIAMLLQQATPSFIGDGINIAGATGLENHYFVDGIDITNPVLGDKSMDLPYNFIQQIQIHTGGASAEDAMTLGGTVNVVTPSGGNDFAGSTFGFFSSSALQSTGRVPGGATQSGFAFYDAGATVSGPVARDHVWFFAAYNPRFERRDFSYGFGSMADETLVHQFAGKLTASLGKNTTAALTLLGDPRRSTRATLSPIAPPGLAPLSRDVLHREDRGGGYAVSSRVQSQLGRSLLLESTLSHMALRDWGTPLSGAALFVDYDPPGTLSGGHGWRYRGEARRQSASADLSSQLRNHYLKVGARYEVLRNTNSIWVDQVSHSTGTYVHLVTTADAPGSIENRNPSVFIQDVWQATERLSVSAGVRQSRQQIVNLSGSRGDFRVHDGLQPRAAVVYQLGPLGTQRVFASYARVVQQVTLIAAVGAQRGHTLITAYPQDPRVDNSGGTTVLEIIRDGNGDRAEDKLRATSTEQWSLGYARRIGDAATFSLTGESRRLGEHVTGAGNDGNPIWGNPGRGAMSAFPRPNRRYDALHIGVRQLESDADWWQLGYTLSRTRGNFPGIYDSDLRFASPHYGPTFERAAAWENSTGLLPNDRTHLLKAYGSRALRYGLTIGASMIAASGTPLSEFSTDGAGILFFVQPRGTAGRTPWIFDAAVRASYLVPARLGSSRSQIILDVQQLGNPGRPVDFDQVRYSCLDDTTCVNAAYGRVIQYQPPMTARLGVEVVF
jgi:hypothetical protein